MTPSTIIEGPVEWSQLTDELRNRFLLNDTIRGFNLFIHEKPSNKIGNLWPLDMIMSGIYLACRRQDLAGIRTYDARSVFDLYKMLDKFSIANKEVLVIGSQNPWIEVCCLAFGAKTVTTVDYNPPVSESDQIRCVGVDQFEKESFKYDVLISFSSLEHDGLGRYGDPIDPEADLKRMRSYLDIMKPDGLFFLGVPCGQDTLYWNAHRIYGRIRFPMLTEHWDAVDFFLEGFAAESVLDWDGDLVHAWWVLKPKIWSASKARQ